MKKTLAFILSGSLLLGSAVYAFAGEGVNSENSTEEESSVILTDTETAEESTEIDIDFIRNYLENPDFNLEDLDEDELEALIEEILKALEEDLEYAEDLDTEGDQSVDDEEGTNDGELDDEEKNSDETDEVVENLYKNLLVLQSVYDRVPEVAQPAIRKNIRKVELRILSQQLKTSENDWELVSEEDLAALQEKLDELQEALLNEDLTDEEKEAIEKEMEEVEAELRSAKEANEFHEFLENSNDWEKQLRRQIQEEFLAEKRAIQENRKAERENLRKELQQQRESLKGRIKDNILQPEEVEEGTPQEDEEAAASSATIEKAAGNNRGNGNAIGNSNGNGNGNAGNQGRGNAGNARKK
ncbi:hypothetical protein SAMN05660297_00767 [Natronincola peptidivorans]|uniref:DUF5667 domain-containing protein n=1 Tax=Natronincola peptidivorans TaxID=426128 RepID=A0A1H9ZXB4_9FIRM|nr:hypothetical protein [Natronincola peptidivorans]SES86424.1 hypothetical protein SAMN05660297_00767 [Natronincola peptidivorans]